MSATKNKKLFFTKNNLFHNALSRCKAGFNGSSVIVPHVCNNVNAFGAGFAGAVASNYPIVKENYHMLGMNFLRKNPGHTQFVNVYTDPQYKYNFVFANMIAQNGLINENNKRPLNYAYLVKSMLNIKQHILTNYTDNKVEIHCPKFGCGLAGGNWNFISDLIQDIWGDFTVVVYEYKK
jgi:hypothetical protein